MTLRKAFNILKPPLIFGNPAQIEAVRFIEEVDRAEERITQCDSPEHLLRHRLINPDCECVRDLKDDVVEEASERIAARLRILGA